MALAQPQKDMMFEPTSVNLSFVGIDKFPKEQLQTAVAKGEREIQFDGIRQANEYGALQLMNYKVFMKKYNEPNFYHPYAIEASIEGQPAKMRRFDLTEVPLRIENIQNLLNGRHVEKHRFNPYVRNVDAYWYRLDFEQRNQKNEYPLLEVSAAQLAGKNGSRKWNKVTTASELISRFPIRENLLIDLRLQLAKAVSEGDAVPVTIIKNGSSMKGYMQFGEHPDKIDLLIHKKGKLVKVGTDLQEYAAPTDNTRRARHGKSV